MGEVCNPDSFLNSRKIHGEFFRVRRYAGSSDAICPFSMKHIMINWIEYNILSEPVLIGSLREGTIRRSLPRSFSFPIIYTRTPELVRGRARGREEFGHPLTGTFRIHRQNDPDNDFVFFDEICNT